VSQVTILRTRYPDPRKIIFPQQSQQQSGILPVGLLFAHAFALNLGRIADPQLHTEFRQQPLEPSGVPRHAEHTTANGPLGLFAQAFLDLWIVQRNSVAARVQKSVPNRFAADQLSCMPCVDLFWLC
jgi:hypothetical protein